MKFLRDVEWDYQSIIMIHRYKPRKQSLSWLLILLLIKRVQSLSLSCGAPNFKPKGRYTGIQTFWDHL